MKELVVISGKGGTGKSTLSLALFEIAWNSIIADCDVDAADLFLILNPKNHKKNSFLGGKKAVIDQEKCTGCGLCNDFCRFDAIDKTGRTYSVSTLSCEGCGLCMQVCPENAVHLEQSENSYWFTGETRFGPMVHARLGIGEDNSGKLVTVVREEAKNIAQNTNDDLIIIDGPPGIGCPAIASVSGADLAMVVAEPTRSGVSDMKRILELLQNFSLQSLVVINRFDINYDISIEIEKYCIDKGIKVISKIPFNELFVESLVNRQSILEYIKSKNMNGKARIISDEINTMWHEVKLSLHL